MADPTTPDILGLGCVAADELLWVDAYPPADAKTPVTRRLRQCGGQAANALVAAARLGARCAYAGVLGDDPDSRFVLDALRGAGVDTSHVVTEPDARPIRTTVIVGARDGTRTVLYDLTGARGAPTDAPPAAAIRSARALLVDHFGTEGMLRAATTARAAGVAVVADLEHDGGPEFAALLAAVDHLILPAAFAARLTGEADPPRSLARLWSPGRRAVVVTCGAAGCWYLGADAPDAAARQPAFPVAAVDTTGCGDAFRGAYAAALVRGAGLRDRVRFATAAAALAATHHGAQAGLPTAAQVEALLRRYSDR